MSRLLSSLKQRFAEDPLLWPGLTLGILTASIGLGLYAYLGTFSRYGSDDYCLTAFFFQEDLAGAMIRRYFNASGRYTNILFIGLVDKIFGWYNVAILPPLMLVLLALGLYLLLAEIGNRLALGWRRAVYVFTALWIAYSTILQAPDLYETLYWRAGMTSHFAPLVLILFLGVFLLRQIERAARRSPSGWVQAVCFLGPLLAGGLSEPPTALVVTITFLAIGWVWWRGVGQARRSSLTLLGWFLAGALAALLLMAFAPANSIRLQTAPPGPIELISRTLSYPLAFIVDTLQTLPLPTLASFAVPALLFYVKFAGAHQPFPAAARGRLGVLMIAVLLLAYLLIAATFAPSVYGQSFPIPRARFAGRLLMTGALVTDGALLGILASSTRMAFFRSMHLQRAASLLLILLALYPLRPAWRLAAEVPAYRQRAAAWDRRDAEIRALKEQGERDLVVRFLPEERIQDLGDHKDFRLNRCAAVIYGVHSIVAVPMEEQ